MRKWQSKIFEFIRWRACYESCSESDRIPLPLFEGAEFKLVPLSSSYLPLWSSMQLLRSILMLLLTSFLCNMINYLLGRRLLQRAASWSCVNQWLDWCRWNWGDAWWLIGMKKITSLLFSSLFFQMLFPFLGWHYWMVRAVCLKRRYKEEY